MSHGLDVVETASAAAPEPDAAGLFGRLFRALNGIIVLLSSIALVVASGVLTYSVITRYFLHLSTDWQDELFKQILKALSKFYIDLRIRLEGGKITPLTRARVALKRMLRRLGGK